MLIALLEVGILEVKYMKMKLCALLAAIGLCAGTFRAAEERRRLPLIPVPPQNLLWGSGRCGTGRRGI